MHKLPRRLSAPDVGLKHFRKTPQATRRHKPERRREYSLSERSLSYVTNEWRRTNTARHKTVQLIRTAVCKLPFLFEALLRCVALPD